MDIKEKDCPTQAAKARTGSGRSSSAHQYVVEEVVVVDSGIEALWRVSSVGGGDQCYAEVVVVRCRSADLFPLG